MSNFTDLVRLGKNAEVRYTADGKPVTSFSAAFDSGWGGKKTTVWLDCSAWGERFKKVSEYLLKGTQVVLQGNLGSREYEGKTHITLEVTEIKLTGKGEKSDRPASRGDANGGSIPSSNNDFDDEINF